MLVNVEFELKDKCIVKCPRGGALIVRLYLYVRPKGN